MSNQQQIDINNSFNQQVTQYEFDKRYINQVRIGSGNSSIVFIRFDTQNERYVAIKQFKKEFLRVYFNKIDLVREISTMKKIKEDGNNNFVRLYDAVKIIKQNGTFTYCLVLQKCQMSLGDFLQTNEFKKMNKKQVLQLCLSLAKSTSYLHKQRILHRDLKPQNFLIANRNNKMVPVIGDFGHSRQFQNNIQYTVWKGSPKYVNPNYFGEQNKKYSQQWDVYSLAIIILEILTGEFLFELSSQQKAKILTFKNRMTQQLKRVKFHLQKFENIDQSVKNIIQKCLTDMTYKSSKLVEDLENFINNMNQNDSKDRNQNNKTNFLKKEQMPTQSSQIKTSTESLSKVNKIQPKQEQKNPVSTSQIEINEQQINIKSLQNKRVSSDILPSNPQKQQSPMNKKISNNQYNRLPRIIVEQFDQNGMQNQKGGFKSQISLRKQDQLPKLISTYKNISRKLQTNIKSVEELQKLKIYQQKLKKIKQLQTFNLSQKSTKIVLLFCLTFVILDIKRYCTKNINNPFTQKYVKTFLDTLVGKKNKLFKDLISTNSINNKTIEFFRTQNMQTCELGLQFNNLFYNNTELSIKMDQIKSLIS